MLRVLNNPRRLCNGLTRRDLIQAGGLGVFGLGLSDLLQAKSLSAAESTSTSPSFGKAKRCILLFLYGSPSQHETFDMKPDAPSQIRGTMDPIASSLPGLDVCEHLPEMAKVMDRTTVVRSMNHAYPIHGVAYATTGIATTDVNLELNPFDPRCHPYFGSCLEYVDRQANGGKIDDFVQNVALPFPFSSQRTDQPLRAGPYGSFLGGSYNPIWTEFVGEGTKVIHKARTGFSFTGKEPYIGCTADSHFRMSAGKSELKLDRLDRRRGLLEQFDQTRRDLDRSSAGASYSDFQQLAFSVITSPKVGDALDVRHETVSTRELYGMTLFGQSCLAARRLLEAGTKLVSVFWDEYGLAGDAWDTHNNNFGRLKEQLLPGYDKGYAGLILDLERRGMLDDTLVVCLSEHGRTPKINGNAGRDHWARAYCAHFAGGGIAKGNVIGATDGHASDVTERPVSPKDALATMYHLLGVAPHTLIPDRGGRPVPLVPEGSKLVPEMLA